MARRMFSPDVVCSDHFLDMSTSARELYFQFGMYCDDDGFLSPKKIMRMLGAAQGDLLALLDNGYVIPFESGVIVITHQRRNNQIRKDWYHPTVYQEEYKKLRCVQGKYIYVNEIGTEPVNIGKVRLGKNIPVSFDTASSPPKLEPVVHHSGEDYGRNNDFGVEVEFHPTIDDGPFDVHLGTAEGVQHLKIDQSEKPGTRKSRGPKKSPEDPKISRKIIAILCEEQKMDAPDGHFVNDNLFYVAGLLKKLKTQLIAMGNSEADFTDDFLCMEFRALIQNMEPFWKKNATSIKFIHYNFQKIVNQIK